jgi:hypothetical protein
MTVAIPLTTPAPVAERLPSLWELGQELQDDSRWVAQLAERLDTDDEAERARAIADLEQTLAAEQHSRQAFTRKADATCWVIGRLRAEASYHEQQSKRYAALARNEEQRATALETTLIHWLTRLDPAATRFRLIDHQLSSRLTDAVTIDDPDALPADLVTLTTTRSADKLAIKARIKAAIRTATSGLSAAEAATVAFSIAHTAIPGARLTQRRHWSIH